MMTCIRRTGHLKGNQRFVFVVVESVTAIDDEAFFRLHSVFGNLSLACSLRLCSSSRFTLFKLLGGQH